MKTMHFTNHVARRTDAAYRRGTTSIEVVMAAGVLLALAGALLFLGIKMCAAAYQALGTLVSWPFL